MFDIEEELKKLPAKPGVYLMHDSTDTIIYVGKAISLKNRVRQYFQPSRNVSPKIESMISHIDYFEYIVTDSEMEALVLECNLIKEHSPKYNTMLKDDKSYPYIRATIREPFPRLLFAHQKKNNGDKYFGPYTSAGALKETLEFLRKTFWLRSCKKVISGHNIEGRPCLYHHIGQCKAPCQGYITREEYMVNFNNAMNVLNGNTGEVISRLKKDMEEASENLEFEQAAVYRDKINTIKRIAEKQKASFDASEDRDIIAMAADGDEAVVQVFFIRAGKMIGREHHYLTGVEDELEQEVISTFIKQYYADSPFVPRELFVPCEIEDEDVISDWLSERRGQKVRIVSPKIGEKSKLVELARKNAELVLTQDAERIKKEIKRTVGAVHELSELIGLDGLSRIESYDISNTSGFESVGSMVVYEDGKPKKHDYRKFRIRTVTGPDDYASMREVLTRRFEHGLRDIRESSMQTAREQNPDVPNSSDQNAVSSNMNAGFAHMPDLLLMDGGKGQVNIAIEVLADMNLDIPVCGMVKDDNHRTRGLYYNNKEIPINKNSEAFRLITRIQDETHRFAIEYHKSLRSKEQVRSILDDIEGIGPVRRRALMKYFKSIEAIREASVDELEKVDGMNSRSAKGVYDFFHE